MNIQPGCMVVSPNQCIFGALLGRLEVTPGKVYQVEALYQFPFLKLEGIWDVVDSTQLNVAPSLVRIFYET